MLKVPLNSQSDGVVRTEFLQRGTEISGMTMYPDLPADTFHAQYLGSPLKKFAAAAKQADDRKVLLDVAHFFLIIPTIAHRWESYGKKKSFKNRQEKKHRQPHRLPGAGRSHRQKTGSG